MSGVEIAIPVITATVKLGQKIMDIGLSVRGMHRDAKACATLAKQIKHDVDYAQKLLTNSRDLIRKHEDMLIWISGTISQTKETLARYNGCTPTEGDKGATLEALLEKDREWEEWRKALGANHSSLMAAVNVMHQLKLTQKQTQKPGSGWRSSMPPEF
ncbi:hypothetical protein FCIRC_8599 [Fusarium circinatum]|uniref:Fungal N-terminal domain-containing protein n=1 Tax=Fusarium circinatum TaxID=48490 RepID=A0A8H5TLL2_FUSCI|nr:hypothetical protein FCIRC_8599 [Fusarium circinatum]